MYRPNVAQPISFSGRPTKGHFRAKNTKDAFLPLKWHFVGQRDNHIGWAISLAYTWVSSTYPRAISWNFGEKMFRNDGFEKLTFLKQENSNFKNSKKLDFFCLILVQISHKFLYSMDWIQFLWLLWFPANIRGSSNMRHPVHP